MISSNLIRIFIFGQATALQGQKASIYIGSAVNTNLFGNAELREQMLTLQTRNNIGCTISRCILMEQRLQQRPFQKESILFLDDVPVRVINCVEMA